VLKGRYIEIGTLLEKTESKKKKEKKNTAMDNDACTDNDNWSKEHLRRGLFSFTF
jgi:hypothetical protein